MLSGSSWVSASMKVSAISAKVSANALAPIKLAPKWMMTHAASAPVSISMSGYRMPMGVWQFEHLPRSMTYDSTGIFSIAVIWCPQLGQRDRGITQVETF